MTWLRLMLVALSGLLLMVLTLLGVVLFTSAGNQMIWQQLQRQLPTLHGELVSGHLGVGWEIHNLDFHSSLLDVQAQKVQLVWQAGALLAGQLVVEELALDKPRLTLHPQPTEVAPDSSAEQTAPATLLSLPIRLFIHKLRVQDFALQTPDVMVKVGLLEAAADWQGEQLVLRRADGADVDVALLLAQAQSSQPEKGHTQARNNLAIADTRLETKAPVAPSTGKAQPPSKDQTKRVVAGKPVDPGKPSANGKDQAKSQPKEFDPKYIAAHIAKLPAVFLPFDLQVEQFAVTRARYHQPGFDTARFDVALQGRFVGEQLTLRSLRVKHSWGEAELQGELTFHDYYPMDLQLQTKSDVGWLDNQLKGRQFALLAKGELTDLHTKLTLQGKEGLTLQARLNTLAADLPFTAQLAWHHLQWPLTGKGDYSVDQGKADASGKLSAYRLKLTTQAQALALPRSSVALDLQGSLNGIDLKPLKIVTGHSTLQAEGRLDWQKELNWLGRISAQSANIKEWVPQVSGRIKADIASHFVLKKQGWQLELPKLEADGQLNGYPLTLRGRLQGNDKMAWKFEQIRLTSGANRLELDGGLGQRWQAKGRIDAPALGILYPELSGAMSADFSLQGAAATPELNWRLNAEEIGLPSVRLRQLAAQGSLLFGKQLSGELTLNLGRLRQGSTRIKDLVLTLKGNEVAHHLALQFAGEPIASRLELTGSLLRGRWQGELHQGQLTTPVGEWRLEAPLSIASRAPWQQIQVGKQCWRSDKAGVCLSDGALSAQQGELTVALTHFATERLSPFFPERFSWLSELGVEGLIGWSRGIPRINLALNSGPGQFVTDELTSDYQTLRIKSSLDGQEGALLLDFTSLKLGSAHINLQIHDPMAKRELGGNMKLTNLRLYGIAPLFDELRRTKGRIDADGRFAGTLDAPLFYGEVRLTEGEVDTAAEVANLRQIETIMRINGARADIDGSLMVGKGKLDLGGFVDWSHSEPQGRLTIHADTLEIGLAGYGRARVSADVTASIGGGVQLQGRVMIPWARIKVKNLPDSVVSLSDDVEVVMPRRKAPEPKAPIPFWLDLVVSLGGDVQLDALGLKTKLVGGITMTQTPEVPLRTVGEIRLDDGRFKAYGQNLLISEGKLIFSGNVSEPYLNVEAQRDPETMEDKSVTVGVKVTGPASQPKVTIFSEPQLSETEKLSYLLRGKSTSASGTTSGDEAMTGILLGAGLSQASGLVSGLGEGLGLSDVTLDSAGSGDDTQVSVSGYLRPGLQLQYGVGIYNSISEIRLRYELIPRLYLQALSGVGQALDLFYKFEF